MSSCCWERIDDAKLVSRCKWICPVCSKDVSLEYVIYMESLDLDTKIKTKKNNREEY